jgi:hypothetical protein
MTLADDITIMIGGEEIILRPRLRFAMRLERRDGSFAAIMREVAEGSLSAACEIIYPHYPHVDLPALVLDAGLSELTAPLIAYVGRCTGIEPDDAPSEGKAKGKPVTIAEHLTGLYRIGTGWLGWTPAQTLDATPEEIAEAYRGRLDMLKAIFGGSEAEPEAPATPDQLSAKFKFLFGARARAKREA